MMQYGSYEYVDLTPQQVLQKVSQKQIFEWIMKEEVAEGRLYKSPLRKDDNPGCRFDILPNGDMLFLDFGSTVHHRSCFRMAMDYYNTDLRSVITMICDEFGLSKNGNDYEQLSIPFESEESDVVRQTEIIYQTRKFRRVDRLFWNNYSITEQQLLEDNVFPVSRVIINNYKKNRRSTFRPMDICYAMDFGNAVKLYQPNNLTHKFITNCTVNHVGNILRITDGETLIIAKAYKEHRILRNLDRPDTIWFPSENIIPSKEILRGLCNRFEYIVVFFDNDYPGFKTAYKLVKLLNSMEWGIARMVYVPLKYRHKDLSEFLHREGKPDTIKLLEQLKI